MTVEAWLAEFQREFGAIIRTPLDAGSGTLRARVDRYDDSVALGVRAGPSTSARARLAVYNRQYWFRLFGVLHDDFRLTTLLVGPWQMNEWAAAFWRAQAPSHFDLGRATDAFPAFLIEHAPELIALGHSRAPLPRRTLLQAAAIDDARRRVLLAPDEPILTLGPEDVPRLQRSRLVPTQGFIVVDEDWPLVELRNSQGSTLPEQPLALPAAHTDCPRSWAFIAGAHGHRVIPLSPTQARLTRELVQHPLPLALARVEAECSELQRAELIVETQAWLAESMRLGCWTRLEACE